MSIVQKHSNVEILSSIHKVFIFIIHCLPQKENKLNIEKVPNLIAYQATNTFSIVIQQPR